MTDDRDNLTVPTIKFMLQQIQNDIDSIKNLIEKNRNALQEDIRDLKMEFRDDRKAQTESSKIIENCINKEVKPQVGKNQSDIEWLKKGFWFVAGMGSSALMLTIGIILSSFYGGS